MDNKTLNELFIRSEERIEKTEIEVKVLTEKASSFDKEITLLKERMDWHFRILLGLILLSSALNFNTNSLLVKLIQIALSK